MTTSIPSDPREHKLPVWAQDMINHLRRLLKREQAAAESARLATKPDASNTVIERFGAGPVGLGVSPNVHFKLPRTHHDGRHPELRMQLQRDGRDAGRIHVMLIGGGSGRLDVRPESSNSLTIGTNRSTP